MLDTTRIKIPHVNMAQYTSRNIHTIDKITKERQCLT